METWEIVVLAGVTLLSLIWLASRTRLYRLHFADRPVSWAEVVETGFKSKATRVIFEARTYPRMYVDGDLRFVRGAAVTQGTLNEIRAALRMGSTLSVPPFGVAIPRRNGGNVIELDLKPEEKA